jgi:hypothetical protein
MAGGPPVFMGSARSGGANAPGVELQHGLDHATGVVELGEPDDALLSGEALGGEGRPGAYIRSRSAHSSIMSATAPLSAASGVQSDQS